MVPSGRGLACGLQDQRLMARPPARAGGRSGLLTEGKTGTRTVTLCLFPKGTHPRPPARPAGGRAVTDLQCEGRRPGIPVRSTASPTNPPPEKGSPEGRTSSLWVLSPFLPKKWGARAGQRSLPFQRRGRTRNAPAAAERSVKSLPFTGRLLPLPDILIAAGRGGIVNPRHRLRLHMQGMGKPQRASHGSKYRPQTRPPGQFGRSRGSPD